MGEVNVISLLPGRGGGLCSLLGYHQQGGRGSMLLMDRGGRLPTKPPLIAPPPDWEREEYLIIYPRDQGQGSSLALYVTLISLGSL